MDTPHLSIIIPAYNEERRIKRTLDAIKTYLDQKAIPAEVIVVINNTTDNTKGVVEEQARHMPYVRVLDVGMIPNQKGRTKGLAVRWGINEARGRHIIFMDADNATDISEMEKMWPKFDEGYDVVIGSRFLHDSNVKRAWYRKVVGYLVNEFIHFAFSLKVVDTQCGFKAFTHDAAKEIFSKLSLKGWAFDLELLVIAQHRGYRIAEVPVVWREIGESRLNVFSALLSSFPEMMAVWRNLRKGKYN